MTLPIIHRRSEAGVAQKLGPYEITSLISPEEEGAVTAYHVRIGPRETTAVSYHNIAEELYYVIAGSGVAILNGERHPLATGDFLRLPPGTRHGFETGEEALEMLDIHSPGSRPDRDVYFEGEAPEGFRLR